MSRVLFRLSLQVSGVLRICDKFPTNKNLGRVYFNVSNKHFSSEKDDTKVPVVGNFENTKDKTKDMFLEVLNNYRIKETHRRGHVEFIYGALKYMKEFGVEKDLEVYRALVDVLPKGKFVPQNILQAEFMHYPKQQQCILDLLSKMEYNRVIPDPEFGELLANIFGKRGYPVRKYMRMLYWMPKFKNLSPWPVPDNIPKEPFDLAMLAIKRITSVDPATKISVFSTRLVEDAVDDTWIISGQSKEQKDLLAKHQEDKPVYIEGAFRVWLRDVSVYYFVLRGDPVPREEKTIDIDDVTKINVSFFTPPVSEVAKVPSIHEQEDGIYYAVCATGSSSRDSLLSWVRLLQKENHRLLEVPVVFTLRAPSTELVKVKTDKNNGESKSENPKSASDETIVSSSNNKSNMASSSDAGSSDKS